MRLFKKPESVLFFTQVFSTISYAVLYSSLVLFMTQALHFSAGKASAIMGVFVAFNFGLHLLGGYIGGRLVSYRILFLLGMILQIAACYFLSIATTNYLYIALALFLTGSGLNVPCINMMLTQQFKPDDTQREFAFFWNYAGMNLGFFAGFTVAGMFQNSHAYETLFLITTITNVIAFITLSVGWKLVADRTTPLVTLIQKKGHSILATKNTIGFAITAIVAFLIYIALKNPLNTDYIALIIGLALMLMFIFIAKAQSSVIQKSKVYAYLILSFFGLAFWSAYSLAPMGLTLFTQHNVNRHFFDFVIPTQWFQNVNTIVIVVGGFSLPTILRRVRKRFVFSFPMQFASGLCFMSIGLLMLPIGILLANKQGYSSFYWLILSYFFQSIGELMIGPTGYAMIGKLASPKLQGLMMGSWMVVTGSTSGIIASLLSIAVAPKHINASPLITNGSYDRLFLALTVIGFIAAFFLYRLVPYIRKMAEIRVTS